MRITHRRCWLTRLGLAIATALVGLVAATAQGPRPSGTLPIVAIEVPPGQTIEIGFSPACELYVYDAPNGPNALTDAPTQVVAKAYTRIRGASSLGYPKKNYGFEVRDSATQAEVEVSIFGFPKHEDWALHGPYADKSLMRNALAYHWAARYMPWAPRNRFCELVVDGDYKGVYLFTERVKRDNDRVDIARLRPTDTDRDDITGGYMLEIGDDPQTEFRSFNSAYSQVATTFVKTQYQLDYPNFDSLGPGQYDYIRGYVRDIEDRLAAPDYTDAADGYANYVDVPSWVDFAIIQELSGNFDAYRRSTWVVKDRDDEGGRFAAGPAWDFDIAFGNDSVCLGQDVEGWVMQTNGPACDLKSLPFFVQRMWDDPMFRARLRARWEGLRQNELSDARLVADIDSLTALLARAQPHDQARWQNIGLRLPTNAFVGQTWAAEVDYLRTWILRRTAWLDANVRTLPRVADLQARNTTLPVLRIDVAGRDTVRTGRAPATLRAVDNGPDQLNSPDGAATDYRGAIAVELEGAADTKSTYRFELRRDSGEDYAYALLGLPKEEDWQLRGPYSDKTLVRDLVGARLARVSGRYAPRMRAVELYLNDAYAGIYVLAETVKRDGDRVAIARLDPDDSAGDALTGGYLLEVDGDSGDPAEGFTGAAPLDGRGAAAFYALVEPDADDVTPAQRAYIQGFVREIEREVQTGGAAAVADRLAIGSFVYYMLLQELSGNARAYTRRTFLHKDRDSRDGRLAAGPASDFNRAFGNDEPCGGTTVAGWLAQAGGRCGDDATAGPLWRALWSDPGFRAEATTRWRALRQNGWTDAELAAAVRGFAERLAPETARNFARYPILGQRVGRNAYVGQTYAEEVDYLEDWLVARARWIDGNIDRLSDTSLAPDAPRLTLSPNPGLGATELTIGYDAGTLPADGLEIQLFDIAGRLVYRERPSRAFGRITVPIARLPQGAYVVRLRGGDGRGTSALWVR